MTAMYVTNNLCVLEATVSSRQETLQGRKFCIQFAKKSIAYFSIITYILFANKLCAQSLQWGNAIVGNHLIYNTDFVIDNQNNNIQTGYFFKNVDFDPSLGIDTINASAISGDTYDYGAFITKSSSNGNHLWAKALLPYFPSSRVKSYSISTDNIGNMVVVGDFIGTVDFDPGVGIDTVSSNNGFYSKSFMAKYDMNGNLVWVYSLNTRNLSIKFDHSNNILIAGDFYDTVDFNPGVGVYNITTVGGSQFLLKFDQNGNFLWVKSWNDERISYNNTTSSSSLLGIDDANNVFVCLSSVNNTLDADPGNPVNMISGKYFVVKLDSLGFFLWAGSTTTTSPLIHIDKYNNLYTAGWYMHGADTDPGPGIKLSAVQYGTREIFISKNSPSGNLIWTKNFTRVGAEDVSTLTTDTNGNLILGGNIYFDSGNIDFDPDTSSYIVETGSNGDHIFFCSLDSSSQLLWAKTISKSIYDGEIYADVNNWNELYFSGTFRDETDIDPSPLVYLVGEASKHNLFLMKYNYCGQINHQYHVGCDSVVTIDSTYLQATNYVVEYLDVNNCDSTVNIHVNLLNPLTSQIFNSCDTTISYNGITYNQSGTYTQTVSNTLGCDSVHTLHINFNTPATQPPFLNLIQTIQPLPSSEIGSLSIEIDSLYSMYVSGMFTHSVDFNPLGSPYIDSSYYPLYNGSDGFVTRYDSSGMLIWMHKFQTMDPNGSESVGTLKMSNNLDLNCVVYPYGPTHQFGFNTTNFGTTQIGSFFMPGYFGYVRIQDVLNDANSGAVIKIGSIDSGSNTAKQLYVTKGNNVAVFPSGGDFVGYRGAIDMEGNIYVATNMQALVGGPTNCTIVKLDSNLNLLWNKPISLGDAFGLSPQGLRINALKFDDDNQLYLCGRFSDSVDFDVSPAFHILTSQGGADAFFAKYDSSMNLFWAHSFGGVDYDQASSLDFDLNENVYLGGYFGSTTIDLDPSSGVSFFDKSCLNSNWMGGFISKYKQDGTFIKAMGSGGSITELQFKTPNRIYTTGSPMIQVFELVDNIIVHDTLVLCMGDSLTVGSSVYYLTGTYVDTFALSLGVDSVVITHLSVNPLPNVIANSTDTSICLGDSVVLFGSGASAYSWNNGVTDSVSFYPMNTSMYLLTGTDTNGCVGYDSILIQANQVQLPILTFSGDTLYSTNVVGVQYYWFRDSLVIDSLVDHIAITQNGNYSVLVVDSNGCVGVDTFIVINLAHTEVESNYLVKLFPNPTSGEVNIEFETDKVMDIDLILTDLIGNTLFAIKYKVVKPGVQHFTLNLKEHRLSSGLYIVYLNMANQQNWIKLLYEQ